jgi:predicted anti-sigma-YlaC factor YlaD
MSLTCKEVARLVSEGLDRGLSADERAKLHAHFAFCRGCRSISERLAFLRRAMQRVAGGEPPEKP